MKYNARFFSTGMAKSQPHLPIYICLESLDRKEDLVQSFASRESLVKALANVLLDPNNRPDIKQQIDQAIETAVRHKDQVFSVADHIELSKKQLEQLRIEGMESVTD